MSENKGNTGGAPKASASIEDNLRKVYQEILNEEIPDRLKDLLAQLRASQGVAGSAKAATAPAGLQQAGGSAPAGGASIEDSSDSDGDKGGIGST